MIFLKQVCCRQNCRIKSVTFSVSSQLSTKAEHLVKRQLTDSQTKLYEKHRKSILFSSFIEDNKIKLGYRKNQIMKNMLQKIKMQSQDEEIQNKPLSLTAQLLKESKSKENDENPIATTDHEYQTHRNILDSIKDTQTQSLLEEYTDPRHLSSDADENNCSWMRDYETFDDSNKNLSRFGTPDPTVPVSQIPCYGCGAHLQCANSSLPGYLPSELFRNQPNSILKTITCQRCHFLKHYNTAINLTVSSEEYITMLSSIHDKFALAVLMVDLTDLPCSIWPNITDIIGVKRPVFIVGNKVDLLPKDCRGHLEHVKHCLEQSIIHAGISTTNIKHICLISAQTGYGVEELITKLHNVWRYKGDVYLMGCTNVGKSSLFNALLRSDYCKVKASNIIRKATASQWPGTTLQMLKFPILRPSDMRLFERTQRLMSEQSKKSAEEKLRRDQARQTGNVKYATLIGHIGRTFTEHGDKETIDAFSIGTGFKNPILTLNEKSKEYVTSKWCYDTPGVVNPHQIINLLTTQELLLTLPTTMIKPKTFLLKPDMSLFLAGLGRVDYLNGPGGIRLTVYAANTLPIMIVQTNCAEQIYEDFLGTEFLAVPIGDEARLQRWLKLENVDVNIIGEGEDVSACDILLSSAGWIGISIHTDATAAFRIWTPQRKGIFIRKPALIPYGIQLRGSKIRRSLAYRCTTAFSKK